MVSPMREIFQAQAQVQSAQTLVDGSIKLAVVTQELPAEDLARLFKLRGKLGWFLFKESDIKSEDIPTEEIKLEGTYKSPSERFRSVLYIYWQQNTDQSEDFTTVYYPKYMEKLINQVKEKLT